MQKHKRDLTTVILHLKFPGFGFTVLSQKSCRTYEFNKLRWIKSQNRCLNFKKGTKVFLVVSIGDRSIKRLMIFKNYSTHGKNRINFQFHILLRPNSTSYRDQQVHGPAVGVSKTVLRFYTNGSSYIESIGWLTILWPTHRRYLRRKISPVAQGESNPYIPVEHTFRPVGHGATPIITRHIFSYSSLPLHTAIWGRSPPF